MCPMGRPSVTMLPAGGAVTAAAGIPDDDHVRVVSCVIDYPSTVAGIN